MSRAAKDRWVDVVALAALAALTLLFFWKIALTNRVLAGLDVFAYFYPYRDFVSEAFRHGRLPLWNPYLFMGAPLLANSQAAVLYPLHWPFIWLSAPKQIAWSIVLHIWLAGAGTYLFARRAVQLRWPAALGAATLFAFGGFLSAQAEHINQLNASAWLPWLFLCLEGSISQGKRRWLAMLGGGAIVGLMLLAGHTQAAYIVLSGTAVYALLKGLKDLRAREWAAGLRGVGALVVMGAIGVVLAAGQLLPTLELSQLSVRSGGLPYNEAASFSLKPALLFKAFLPPLIWDPPFSEYVAYVGLLGLALALVGAWAILRRRRPGGALLLLALLGVFLAFGAYNPVYYLLYKLVPGFALFRAPARWLLLYSFGMALLAGIGLNNLPIRKRWHLGLVLLIVLELVLAGQPLAFNNPTAPAAFDSMRTAPSHLLADDSGEPFRFLSMSDISYDPGDMADLERIYASELPDEAIYDLIVATKMKEVLAYNLPLRYRLFSVDGYDGGLLPTKDYVTLERLFLSQDQIWPDGRLRQQLRQIPPSGLLSLLNVKYVITDKTQDVWIDNVYYDLEHTVPLGQVTLADLPDFETTDLGVVSYLTGTANLADGTPVARVTATDTSGIALSTMLLAGEHTAEGLYDTANTAHRQARVGHQWRDDEWGSDYVSVLDLGQAIRPEAISIESLLPGKHVHLRGLTLIDERTGTSRTVSVDPVYQLVHSGDVKIYQNLAVLPRAFIVHQASVVEDEEKVLDLLRDAAFDPSSEVILSEGDALYTEPQPSAVEIVSYDPESVQLQASLGAPGYLVLTDADYPGWEVTVDGQPVPVLRADLYFRAIALEEGEHLVSLHFRPIGTRAGLGISLASWLIWVVLLAVLTVRIGRKGASGV